MSFCSVTQTHAWFEFKVRVGYEWRPARCCTRCGWENILRDGNWVGVDIRKLK